MKNTMFVALTGFFFLIVRCSGYMWSTDYNDNSNTINSKNDGQVIKSREPIQRKKSNTIIWACLNDACRKGDAKKAEEILRHAFDSFEEGKTDQKPDMQAYSMLINAWSNSGLAVAPHRAEMILIKMLEEYECGKLDSKPDTVCYSTIINCWAKSKQKHAPERAEAILRNMKEQYEIFGNVQLRPNAITYSAVMDAYAQCGNIERVEALLLEMYNEYTNGNALLRPGIVCYNILLNAWSKLKSPISAERAEDILLTMNEQYESGRFHVKPDAISYACVIDCWSKKSRNDKNAAQRAERLLRIMQDEYKKYAKGKSNSEILKPTVRHYNSVIVAWSYSRHYKAVERAESLLHEMLLLSSENQAAEYELKNNIVPNIRTYNGVLFTIANSKLPDQIQRAADIIHQMNINGIIPDKYTRKAVAKYTYRITKRTTRL